MFFLIDPSTTDAGYCRVSTPGAERGVGQINLSSLNRAAARQLELKALRSSPTGLETRNIAHQDRSAPLSPSRTKRIWP